ncbi:MAG: hypothetical protein HS111_36090 [Kofleriaceae bacterium]|nr:hypothetical protein [Kofleriaceae bacterium]
MIERAELTVGPSQKPIRAVAIDNLLGDVHVEGHDGDSVTIVAVKQAPDVDALERLRVTLVPDPDGTVRLTTALGDGRERPRTALGSLRLDLTVRVPRAARAAGRVGSGRLVVKHVDGGAELDAGAGTIVVQNVAGRVLARSVDGDQSFTTVFGDLDVHAVDADLALDTIRGRMLRAQLHPARSTPGGWPRATSACRPSTATSASTPRPGAGPRASRARSWCRACAATWR